MRGPKSLLTTEQPEIPARWILPLMWLGVSGFMILNRGLKIREEDDARTEAPCLLLSNHASAVDFAVAVKALFPHRANWVISIEEFVGREWLLRQVGGIYKRKFTSELSLIRHIYTVIRKRKGILVMYPEARYGLAGIEERVSDALGKLVKKMECRVDVLIEHGNFITHPQWSPCLPHPVRVTADRTVLISAEEVKTLSAEELQRRIENAFVYDDYRWQLENHIAVRSRRRAEGLHRILYQCASCGREFTMESRGTALRCTACKAEWEMTPYGQLFRKNGIDRFTHIPDWYRWERENVKHEVEAGDYSFEDTVRVEHLDSGSTGFRAIGTMKLTHDRNGFTLEGRTDSGEAFHLNRTVPSMESVHIEYDFRKRGVKEHGPAIDLCTLTDTYFVFPLTKGAALTKIHFAAEELNKHFSKNG